MSTYFASFTDAIVTSVAGPLEVFTPDLLVLGVFLISCAVWRQVGPRSKQARAVKKLRALETPTSPCTKNVAIRPASGTPSEQPEGAKEHTELQTLSDSSVKAAEVQMLKHLEQREFTRALNKYRSLERDGKDRLFSEEFYTAFIQSAVRVGKLDVVERLLSALKRVGPNPSLNFWQTTLRMLSSRKHFSAVLTVHSIFGRDLPADKTIYSCLINAALVMGLAEQAVKMLGRYSQCGIEIKDFVLFFRTYVAVGDVDGAEAVFNKLGNKVTTLMLNLLLLNAVNAGEAERAFKYLHEAHDREKEEGVNPIVDTVSYNTVLKGLGQNGSPTRCFECLREMTGHGIEPDDITFGTLLDACIIENDMGAAGEIVSLLMESDRKMGTVMYTLFIKGLVRANCLSKALELWEEMRQRQGTRPNIITYSVLIKALVDQHELKRALEMVEDMKIAGHTPDDIILTHLLEGCRHAGNLELGAELFKVFVASGVVPSEFSLQGLLKLHGRCGAHHEAYDIVAGWEASHGHKPSVIHYTCLMSGCLRTKSYDQAWMAFELMCSHKVPLDSTAMATLLPGMVAARQWDRVMNLARKVLLLPLKCAVPRESLNSALSQMQAVGGCSKHAEELQDLMQGAGVMVTVRNSRRAAQ